LLADTLSDVPDDADSDSENDWLFCYWKSPRGDFRVIWGNMC
jgi:hypothetical protein